MQLILFLLSCFGLTQILVYGKIFDKIRPSHHFFHCSMCVGFHVGWFLWLLNGFTGLFTFDYSLVTALVLSCASSGVSYVVSMMFGDEGLNIKIWGDKNV